MKIDIVGVDKTLPTGWWVDPVMSFSQGYYHIKGDVHVFDTLFVRVLLFWKKGTLYAHITEYTFKDNLCKEFHDINRVLRLKNQKRRSIATMRNAIRTFQDKHWFNLLHGEE